MKNEEGPVLFYGGGFNCFSNFSSYAVEWNGELWMTSEHAYQSARFEDKDIKKKILEAHSAYDAKMIGLSRKNNQRKDWHKVNRDIMNEILRAKISQHPHIKEKLLETGERQIIEASKDDSFWGWGPNEDGENHHGKIWMTIREEIKRTVDNF